MLEQQGPQNSISAILITLNEEKNLAKCLESLIFCKEIIIVDGGSSDQTVEIAKSYAAKVFVEAEWRGFGIQKSIALSKAQNEWVFSIDADEIASAELKSSICRAIEENNFAGFYINRRNKFLGRWMRHGGWHPDMVLRLAKRKECFFDETPIHERLLVRGSTSRLEGDLLHDSYPTIESILNKQARYSIVSAQLKSTQRRNFPAYSAFTRALWSFLHNYFLRLGFLDGNEGLIAAVSKSQETFWKYAATSYQEKRQTGDAK
jgi:glycosyltransferase involved in cell wall biosynthesis